MEVVTGIMIAILIFYSGKLIINEELGINNFFSFLAAMMLAYQPVRSLATLNISIQQGISGAIRVLPIIDDVPEVSEKINAENLKINDGEINRKETGSKVINKIDFLSQFIIDLEDGDRLIKEYQTYLIKNLDPKQGVALLDILLNKKK